MEHLVNIEIFGQAYTFKSDAEAATAAQAAEMLAQEVAQVQQQLSGPTSNIPKLTLLILAGLNLSNRVLLARDEFGECIEKLTERSDRLNRLLDEGLQITAPLRVSV